METIITLLQDNPWFQVVAAVVALASAVAAITPTPKEGSFLAKLYKVIDLAAINVGKSKTNRQNRWRYQIRPKRVLSKH